MNTSSIRFESKYEIDLSDSLVMCNALYKDVSYNAAVHDGVRINRLHPACQRVQKKSVQ